MAVSSKSKDMFQMSHSGAIGIYLFFREIGLTFIFVAGTVLIVVSMRMHISLKNIHRCEAIKTLLMCLQRIGAGEKMHHKRKQKRWQNTVAILKIKTILTGNFANVLISIKSNEHYDDNLIIMTEFS